MRALAVIGSLLAATAPAAANDTFEAKAAGAQRVSRIDDLVWALTATCEAGSDTQQRQCRRVRDTRVAQLANATLLVEADRDALSIGAWSPQKKSAALTLTSCIRCTGVPLDGKTWFVVGTKEGAAAPRFKGTKLEAPALYDNAKPFADDAAAKKFAAGAAAARVQLLVKVPAKPRSVVDGKNVLALDVIGYRVASPCDGSVIIASPASGLIDVDKKACAAGRAAVDALSPADIKESMRPVLAAAKDCYAKHQVSGNAKLAIAIAADGSIAEYEQQGDFAGSPTGQCIDTAVKAVAFPPSKKPRTAIKVPVALP